MSDLAMVEDLMRVRAELSAAKQRIQELEAEVLKWKPGCCDREDEAVNAEARAEKAEAILVLAQATLQQYTDRHILALQEVRGLLQGDK